MIHETLNSSAQRFLTARIRLRIKSTICNPFTCHIETKLLKNYYYIDSATLKISDSITKRQISSACVLQMPLLFQANFVSKLFGKQKAGRALSAKFVSDLSSYGKIIIDIGTGFRIIRSHNLNWPITMLSVECDTRNHILISQFKSCEPNISNTALPHLVGHTSRGTRKNLKRMSSKPP